MEEAERIILIIPQCNIIPEIHYTEIYPVLYRYLAFKRKVHYESIPQVLLLCLMAF
jgi:hypothetical protein